MAAPSTHSRLPPRHRAAPAGSSRPTAWLAAALLATFIAACSEDAEPGALGRGVYIEEGWQTSRNVVGHHVHVVREAIACTACHELTADSIGPAVPSRCATCHEKEAKIEHAAVHARETSGPDARSDCTLCHAFTHDGTLDEIADQVPYEATECTRCHLERQGKTPAVAVHGDSDCMKCHRPHEDQEPTSAPCADCHPGVKSSHAGTDLSPTAACAVCHQHQHAPAADARPTCVECHSQVEPKVPASAVFADGHGECVGCHRPHDFEKTAAVSCRSCHEDVPVLGAPRVRQHNQCESCHQPHDVNSSPDRACAGCHKDKHPNHPKHGATATCVGCHDPHPASARAQARARTCSSCHQAAATEKSFHAGAECTKCHTPHQFKVAASDRRSCQACHANELARAAAVPGHQECQGCHGGMPHRPRAGSTSCTSCHAKLPDPVRRGHTQCTSCHEPHGGAATATCRSCHEQEHKSAPRGHQDCQGCHQPHSGASAKATCTSCHASESKTPHGSLPKGCNSCHRPHGPGGVATPPACASCHPVAKLAGLHQEPKHRECAKCHTGHGELTKGSSRAQCLGCHTDRTNHFPDAPRCASCHLFNPTH